MALARLLQRPILHPTSAKKESARPQVIALANQKGGVAKTTTTLNPGVALVERDKRVLCVDLDPQSNLTMSQGVDPDELDRTMFDVLVHKTPLEDVILEREIDLAASSGVLCTS